MRKKCNPWFKKMCVLLVILLAAQSVSAQESDEPVAILEYADDIYEVLIHDADGNEIMDFDLGSEFGAGTVISTHATSLELSISPNGTIIKIAEETTFQLEEVTMADGEETHIFSVIEGQIRTVAAHVTGTSYVFKTDTAVLGVRGTDFIIDTNSDDHLVVLEGEIEAVGLDDDIQEFIGAGEALSFSNQQLGRRSIPDDEFEGHGERHPFNRLDKGKVPFDKNYSSNFKINDHKKPPRALPSGVRDRIDTRRQNSRNNQNNNNRNDTNRDSRTNTNTRNNNSGPTSGGGGGGDRR